MYCQYDARRLRRRPWEVVLCLYQSDSGSFNQPANSNINPPDLDNPYMVLNGQFETFPDTPTNSTKRDSEVQHVNCLGTNDTEALSKVYQKLAGVVSGQDLPCCQPGAVPLVLQDASEWNATGCQLGFFYKCIGSTMTRAIRQRWR